MKKSIKNFIVTIAVAAGTLAFLPTFAMELNFHSEPSTTNSQQIPTESEQIELLNSYQFQLKMKLEVLDRNIELCDDPEKKQTLEKTKAIIMNEIDDNEKHIKKLQETAKLKIKNEK